MTDPLSLTGTAIGIVSLGLQVCQGIAQYYSQWKDFDRDVAAMYTSIDQMSRIFQIIQEKLSTESFSNLPSVLEVDTNITLCESGVLELRRRLEKIKSKEPLEVLQKKAVLLQRLREQGKRLLYPFQQGTLGKLRDIINELRDNLNPILHAVQIDINGLILHEVRQIKTGYEEWRSAENAQKVLSWLSPLNFHQRHQEILSMRHTATGEWFFQHDKFRAWYSGAQGAPPGLWCSGKMGSGKSVLLASVVEHLRLIFAGENIVLAYIYCDWQDRAVQTANNLIGCLVKQLAEHLPAMPLALSQFYEAYKSGKKSPMIQDQLILFHKLANNFRHVFVLADGLDECGNPNPTSQGTSMTAVEGLLKGLLGKDRTELTRIRLLISSRFDQQLIEQADRFELVNVSATTEDLTAFVRSELENSSQLSPWVNAELGRRFRQDAKMCHQIAERCVSEADKTFLLPRLHINHLKQQINMKQLQKATRLLSADVSQSISNTMDRIQAQAATLRDIGTRVLFWILRAMRPLKIEELRHALTVELNDGEISDDEASHDEFLDDNFTEEGLIPRDLIISTCAGLVSVDDQTGTIRLIHLSIKQYLEKIENLWFPLVHLTIARTCVRYVSMDAFLNKQNDEQEILEEWLAKYKFLAYSLENWGHHARLASTSRILDEIKKMLVNDDWANFLFRGLYLVLWKTLQPCADQIPGSFLAAYFGLVDVNKALIAEGEEPDRRDSMGRTALFIAAAMGQLEVVKTLIELDADVSGRINARKISPGSAWWLPPWARDDKISHALSVAAESGHREVVQLLIEHRADIGATGAFNDGALEGAAFWGQTEVVKLLLQHGAKITRNTLQSSAYSGRVDVLETFLNAIKPRADSEKISLIAAVQDLPKALYAAALAGRTLYTERLLKYGVDPNEGTNTSYRTPLQAAASQGHIEIMRLLLRYGAVIDSTAECKRFYLINSAAHHNKDTPGTALEAAAFAGQIEAVRLLLKEGAKVNIESGYYGTALQSAAAGGHYEILEFILGHQAQVNTQCGLYGNPLQAAASKGSVEMVQALLNSGAEINATGGIFGHVLQAAAWSGNALLLRLLVDAGAGLHTQSGRFGNALQAASVGCPVLETRPLSTIPKATTLSNEFQSYTNRPIDRRVISNMIASQIYGSRMRIAGSSISRKNPMRGGADTLPGIEKKILMTQEGEAREVFLESPENSMENTEVVKWLLDAGADPNATGGKYYTALQAACYAGHLEIVDVLLKRGADLHASYDEAEYPWFKQDALGKAIDSGHTVIVKRLLEKGADPNGCSAKSKVSALHRAAKTNADIVRLLIDAGAAVDALDQRDDTPIGQAVCEDKREIVELLLQRGADVNIRRLRTQSLLELSVPYKSLEITTALVQAGADIESIDVAFRSILLADISSQGQWYPKKKETFRLLLDHGAHCNVGTALDRDLATEWLQTKNAFPPNFTHELNPLSIAASRSGDNVQPLEMLVHAGADLQRYGADALWLAVRFGHGRIARYLIEQGVKAEKAEMELLNSVLRAPEEDV